MGTTPPRDVIAGAQASQAKYGISTSISLAQWAVESAWGIRMPPGSNNPFGIKALAGQASVTVPTREVIAGRSCTINAAFRAFGSLAEAFDAHGKLLVEGRPYVAARRVLPNADTFADTLTGVYATDPNYGTTLRAVMRGSNLYQYDGVRPAAARGPALRRRPAQRCGVGGGKGTCLGLNTRLSRCRCCSVILARP